MKFIIYILTLFLCFACDSPSTSQASTDVSFTNSEVNSKVNTEVNTEEDKEINQTKETEIKDNPIKIGTDKVLFKCFGTEPFWNITIRKSGILFANSGTDSIIFAYTEPIAAEGRKIDYHKTYFLEDQNAQKAQLTAKKSQNCPCSDGMSDNSYEYHVSFLYKNQLFEGCGSSVTSN